MAEFKSALWDAIDKNNILQATIAIRSLERDSVIECRDEYGKTAFMYACSRGRGLIAELLFGVGACIDSSDKGGGTAISHASWYGHAEIVEFLLDVGANINTMDRFGDTPIIWAAKKGHVDVIKILCERNANIDTQDMSKYTPPNMGSSREKYKSCKNAFGTWCKYRLAR